MPNTVHLLVICTARFHLDKILIEVAVVSRGVADLVERAPPPPPPDVPSSRATTRCLMSANGQSTRDQVGPHHSLALVWPSRCHAARWSHLRALRRAAAADQCRGYCGPRRSLFAAIQHLSSSSPPLPSTKPTTVPHLRALADRLPWWPFPVDDDRASLVRPLCLPAPSTSPALLLRASSTWSPAMPVLRPATTWSSVAPNHSQPHGYLHRCHQRPLALRDPAQTHELSRRGHLGDLWCPPHHFVPVAGLFACGGCCCFLVCTEGGVMCDERLGGGDGCVFVLHAAAEAVGTTADDGWGWAG